MQQRRVRRQLLAARGIVRVLPDGSWTPKAAFHALAEYGRTRMHTPAK